MNPVERQSRAIAARQFMDNPLFNEMFEGVGEYLEQKALSCDPDHKEQAQRVIVSKQILASLRREIERRMQDGDYASFEIAEMEKQGIARFFRR